MAKRDDGPHADIFKKTNFIRRCCSAIKYQLINKYFPVFIEIRQHAVHAQHPNPDRVKHMIPIMGV